MEKLEIVPNDVIEFNCQDKSQKVLSHIVLTNHNDYKMVKSCKARVSS